VGGGETGACGQPGPGVAELRGVQVRASRMLSSDEMIVTLSVPGRSRSIQARDFTGMDTASVGLVRRVENMVSDTPTTGTS